MELRCLFWGKQTKNWITHCLLAPFDRISHTRRTVAFSSCWAAMKNWKVVKIFSPRRGSAKSFVRKYRHSKLMSNLRWFYHLSSNLEPRYIRILAPKQYFESRESCSQIHPNIPQLSGKKQSRECKCFQNISDLRLALGYVTTLSQILILWMFFLHSSKHISHPFCFQFLPQSSVNSESSCLVDPWTTFNPEIEVNIWSEGCNISIECWQLHRCLLAFIYPLSYGQLV